MQADGDHIMLGGAVFFGLLAVGFLVFAHIRDRMDKRKKQKAEAERKRKLADELRNGPVRPRRERKDPMPTPPHDE